MYDLSKLTPGVSYLLDGYIEYAEAVICERALASLYDGLKPVNRRILYMMKYEKKRKGLIKSGTQAGDILALHPHGDQAIYDAMVLMTDKNGSLAFPLLLGHGNFGGVYKTDPAAAMRYTEVDIHPNANEFFGEMNGIKMRPNYDATMNEPDLLPVSFPNVLVNSTSGIAVGFRSNVPSFNISDVCDLVEEYVRDGECHTVIAPDFVTGGYYVKNNKELMKLMKTGSGRIKLRAKHIIDGKNIIITEVPYGKTIQGILAQIENKNIDGIKNAYDTDDFSGMSLTVACKSKNRIEEVLYELYKKTDLQYSYSADMTVIDNSKPVKLGVWGIIKKWVTWRKKVIIKDYKERIANCRQNMREAWAFMTVVNDKEKCKELVDIIVTRGRAAGKNYVESNFSREDIPLDLVQFVSSRGLQSYYDGGKYKTLYDDAMAEIHGYERDIENIDDVIIREARRIKATYGSKMPRRTEVSTQDYEFSEDAVEEQIDESPCYYSLSANGFFKKTRYESHPQDEVAGFEGKSNDVLIAFDNRGRLLRVYCQDIMLHSDAERGLYLPRGYFGLNESDDYKILWIGRTNYSEVFTLLYKDGTIGFVDTSEWAGSTRNVRVLEKGISQKSAPYLGAVLEGVPEVLFVTDEQGRIGWCYMSEVKRKGRKSSTRVFNLRQNALLDSYCCTDANTGALLLANVGRYKDKLDSFDYDDFRGDPDDFIMM